MIRYRIILTGISAESILIFCANSSFNRKRYVKLSLPYLLLSALLVCCAPSASKPEKKVNEQVISLTVPSNEIDKSKLAYNPKTSLWTLDSALFSGYMVSYSLDSVLIQKIGILDGRKQNKAFDWYPDGRLKHTADYHKGKLHGEKKTWSHDSTHILLSHFNYHLGKAHGIQKKWYPTGEIFKILQMNNGKEDGLQQAFRENGALYTNYEAREGRIFGLKRASLCFELEDGGIKRKKNEGEKMASSD